MTRSTLPIAVAVLVAAGCTSSSSPTTYPPVKSGGCSPHASHAWLVPAPATSGGGAGQGGAGGAGGATSAGGAGGAGGAEPVDCARLCDPKTHCEECSKVAIGGYTYGCKPTYPDDAGAPRWVCVASYACPDAR